MLRLEDRRRAQALIAGVLVLAACGDDEPAARLTDAGPPSCSVVCFEVMPGEWRTDCVDSTGASCAGSYPVCNRDLVSAPDRDRTFIVPQCLSGDPADPREPYCGTTPTGDPAFGHAPIVACSDPAPP